MTCQKEELHTDTNKRLDHENKSIRKKEIC
jgi:hypothetical protein